VVIVNLSAIRVFHAVVLLHAAETLIDFIERPHVQIFKAAFEPAVIRAKEIHAHAPDS